VKASAERRWARGRADVGRYMKRRHTMNNIFYIIGVVVVVAVVLGYFGLR
jgi:predicted nucleic acid-binding Zn ribbon protein